MSDLHLQGLVYRALNPVYARDPLSGRGAALYGGRFNPKGVPALYTCRSIAGAIREANQVGTLQPTMLVAYRADITPIFDGTDSRALLRYDLTPADLAHPGWRNGDSPTQTFATRLIADGYAGLMVPSYAAGATPQTRNVVLWDWDGRLAVVDDDGRLEAQSGA